MPSDKHNSRTARARDLISSLINIASFRVVPIACIIEPLCAPILSSQPHKDVDLQLARKGFSTTQKYRRDTFCSYNVKKNDIAELRGYGCHTLIYGACTSQVNFHIFCHGWMDFRCAFCVVLCL